VWSLSISSELGSCVSRQCRPGKWMNLMPRESGGGGGDTGRKVQNVGFKGLGFIIILLLLSLIFGKIPGLFRVWVYMYSVSLYAYIYVDVKREKVSRGLIYFGCRPIACAHTCGRRLHRSGRTRNDQSRNHNFHVQISIYLFAYLLTYARASHTRAHAHTHPPIHTPGVVTSASEGEVSGGGSSERTPLTLHGRSRAPRSASALSRSLPPPSCPRRMSNLAASPSGLGAMPEAHQLRSPAVDKHKKAKARARSFSLCIYSSTSEVLE
jgi:hypothetical protein